MKLTGSAEPNVQQSTPQHETCEFQTFDMLLWYHLLDSRLSLEKNLQMLIFATIAKVRISVGD